MLRNRTSDSQILDHKCLLNCLRDEVAPLICKGSCGTAFALRNDGENHFIRFFSTTPNSLQISEQHETGSRHCVTDTDRCRLGAFLASHESGIWGAKNSRDKLEVLLENSEAVDSRFVPETLVTMNSALRLVDLHSARPRTVTLVYPDDVDLFSDGISILDPLGTALLGCRGGDVIQCLAAQCQRRFRVAEVINQPERVRASNL